MPHVAVIADDLSGAVETAAGFLLRTTRINVTTAARPASHGATSGHVLADPGTDVEVVDTHSRELDPAAAADRVAGVIAALADVPVVIKKIDSLLRGNLAVELRAVRAVRPHVVVAPALPATGRTVREGQVWVGDRLLHETDVWRAESGAGPVSVAHALAPLQVSTVPLAVVRGPELAARLREILAGDGIPVCDSETDADLDRIVAAMAGFDRPVFVGSAGIATAVARALTIPPAPRPPVAHRRGAVLAVVGSAAPGIVAQLAAVAAQDVAVLSLRPTELVAADRDNAVLAGLVDRLGALSAPVVVVSVDAADGVDPQDARALSRALTAVVADTAAAAAGLVLTGGETARAVLDRLGVTGLRPLSVVHHGAVVCIDDAGRAVATRPGSFGDRDSLRQLISAVRDAVTAPSGPVIRQVASPHPPEEPA